MKQYKTLLLLVASFIAPVIIAKLVLNQQLYQSARLNQGAFLEQEVQLSLESNRQWLLVYYPKQECDQTCSQTLALMDNIINSLGREQDRVRPLLVSSSELAPSRITQQQISGQLETGHIYISDPLGLVLLAFPMEGGKQARLLAGKKVQSDLRKLLKMSRVG